MPIGFRPLQTVAALGQNADMPVVARFIASNGRSVTKLVTTSGVTAYMADEVPLEALIGLAETLRRQLGLPADRGPAFITPSRRNGERGLKKR